MVCNKCHNTGWITKKNVRVSELSNAKIQTRCDCMWIFNVDTLKYELRNRKDVKKKNDN
jgi:hypothetical protein